MEEIRKEIRINDGAGLFDAAGLCSRLLVILNDMEFRGVRNAQHAYLLASGLEALRDGLKSRDAEGGNDGEETGNGYDSVS